MSYDAVHHARDQVAYALRVLDEAEEHRRRVSAWAWCVLSELPADHHLRVQGEILFPKGDDDEAHAPDCAVAVNARHDCSCLRGIMP